MSYNRLHNTTKGNLIGSADIPAEVTKTYPVSPDPAHAAYRVWEQDYVCTCVFVCSVRCVVSEDTLVCYSLCVCPCEPHSSVLCIMIST